jgi:vacuolar-type H+-ATPase subunit F/Vma7
MGAVVAIGPPADVAGYALAGATVIAAATADDARAAWAGLGDDVALAVLAPSTAVAIGDALGDHPDVLTAVLP